MSKQTILIAGGSGLVGKRLQELLPSANYNIHILSRSKRTDHDNVKYFQWDLQKKYIEKGALQVDHIINLTGAGIADKRWSDERKKIIIRSRIDSLLLLRDKISEQGSNSKSLISASAIGYYGNRANENLVETSTPGKGFLPECCIQWENAAKEAFTQVRRGVILRIGIVLSTKGGALPKVLMTSPLRFLSYFGNGSQYYSWIHIDDLCRMFIHAINTSDMEGIYNAVGSQPLTNKIFTRKIAHALPGPYLTIPAPTLALKLVLGEMASVVMDSTNVSSEKIEKAGYTHRFRELPAAITDLKNNAI